MKILHTVEFYSPSVGGMQEVVKQLSERLVQNGHQVTVATKLLPARCQKNLNGVQVEEFNISGNYARGMTGEVERYQRFLIDSPFDVITNFAAQQWATDAMLPVLEKISARKVFVPTGFSGLYSSLYRNYFISMKGWMKQYDRNVFLSSDYRDINYARENGVRNAVIIPNGANEVEFLAEPICDIRARLGIPHNHILILLVGSHTGLKGHAEVIRIFSKTQIKDATLLIVANDSGGGCARACNIRKVFFNKWPKRKLDRKCLIITTLSRQETIAAYHGADLFLFPSNIECSPLVLFECMASRTPFLSTDVGNAAEIVNWSNSGVILPTTIDMSGYSRVLIEPAAKILAQVALDSDRRIALADNGFKVWQKRFTWDKISKEYESLYTRIVQGEICT